MHFSTRKILLFALLAGSFNFSGRLLGDPGGDTFFHYSAIQCFLNQFWQGDLYPRWCMDANAGLGAPVFLFYFPLPYYITALLYPLHALGGVETIYLAGLWLVNVVSFITCFIWLRDIISPGRALLCAGLFLFLPYRMELLMFRSAFAELWCMAFLPLLFLYTRRIAHGDVKNWVKLAWVLVACLLSHVTATFIGLIGTGLYAAGAIGYKNIKPYGYLLASLLLAIVTVAFYLLPAKHFMQYLHPDALEFVRTVWVNHYITIKDFTENDRARILITLGITLLFVIGLGITTWLKRAQITDSAVRRDVGIWLVIAAFATFLLFQVSAPLWYALSTVSTIISPWRAQILIMFAAIMLIAIRMQWLMTAKSLKTWKSDYASLLGLFALLGLFVLDIRLPEVAEEARDAIKANIVVAQEYRTRWTDKKNIEPEKLMAHFKRANQTAKANVINGKGEIEITRWGWDGIAFTSTAQKESVVRLEHFYFPLWRMTMDGKVSDGLSAQEKSGAMLVRAPAGKHDVYIKRDMKADMGTTYTLSLLSSLLGLATLLLLTLRNRRAVI